MNHALNDIIASTHARTRRTAPARATSVGLAAALAAVLVAGLCVPAQAGTIDARVAAQAEAAGPGGTVSVLIHLAEQAPLAALHQQLKETRASRAERHETVVRALQETAARTQGPLIELLSAGRAAGEVVGFTPHWITNVIVAQVRPGFLEVLATRGEVEVVEPNFEAELVEPVARAQWLGDRGQRSAREPGSEGTDADEAGAEVLLRSREIGVPPGLRAIHADLCWSELGLTGAGTLICGLDTGVDGEHPALATRWRGYGGVHPPEECWLDVLADSVGTPYDADGHGTHTMGTMCGIDPAEGDTVGVAWGAEWIAANAIDQAGWNEEFDNDVIVCFEWIADPDGDPQTVDDVPDVCQNSWGGHEFPNDENWYYRCDDRWWNAIDNCETAGVIVVFSAGNEGPDTMSCGIPADRNSTPWNTYAVGALDATNHIFPYPIAGFSSRGPSGCDEITVKPEVSAPGVDVVSCFLDGGYAPLSGTSMAGPHVSGVCALMREIDPDLEVDRAKQILMDTAVDLGEPGEDHTFGWGLIDAYAACLAVMHGYGNLAGGVAEAGTGLPLAGARVSVAALHRTAWSQEDGAFDLRHLPAGDYEVTTELFGYEPDVSVVTITDEGSTNLTVSLVSEPRGYLSGQVSVSRAGGGRTPGLGGAGDGEEDARLGADPVREGIEGFVVSVLNAPVEPQVTDASGNFFFDALPVGSYDLCLGRFGWTLGLTTVTITEGDTTTYAYTPLPGAWDDFEYDQGWTVGVPGDEAFFGVWEPGDPNATYYIEDMVAPEDDHTPNGVRAFVTQNQPAGANRFIGDVDGGRTTLVSPVFDATPADNPSLVYHRWFHNSSGYPHDQQLRVDVSSDGGQTWTNVETLAETQNSWERVEIPFGFHGIPVTDQMQVRFVAEDIAWQAAVVEAAIDDVEVRGYLSGAPQTARAPALSLSAPHPNPLGHGTLLKLSLPRAQEADVAIYDSAGRLVRHLLSGEQPAGEHRLFWDGKAETGRPAYSGVYFVRLATGERELTRRIVVSR